jgi:glycine oxidase
MVPTGFDVIVVGGGAVGAACARELALTSRKVLVVEPGGDQGQAWRAAAGMLAPQIEAGPDDPVLDFGVAARDHYFGVSTELLSATGIDIGLWQEGIAHVATRDADASSLQAKVLWQQQRGYTCDWLNADQVRSRWPWLGPASGALWAPHDGALDPQRLVEALTADAVRLGATMLADRVIRLECTGHRVTGVTTTSGSHPAPQVVLAAGAWSPLIEGLPRPLPIQPVRGQMAALPWPAGVARAILYNKDCYLLARGSEAIIGSTMEHVGFRPEVTSSGVAQIFAALMELCPGLVRAKVRRTWAGLRPITRDGLPIIGPEPRMDGLWYATGHGRNGILLAGLTGKLMARLIAREAVGQDIEPFAPERFG